MKAISCIAILCFLAAGSVRAESPYVISEKAQRLSIELGVPEKLGLPAYGARSSDIFLPTAAIDIVQYFDVLTAIDVMAKHRIEAQGKPDIEDEHYRAVMAALCFFPPNKPHTINFSKDVLHSFEGSYGSEQVRRKIAQSMKPLLLKGSLSQVVSFFDKPVEFDAYVRNIYSAGF